MNFIKKTLAILMTLTLALSITACHKKNEIAVKVGDVEFTSAYYMCALIEADLAAKQEVDDKAQEDTSIDTSKEGYYYTQKFDGKTFEEYVKANALDKLKENAAYITKCKENKIELGDDKTSVDSYAEFYWSSYGYSEVYEPNGVSKETFTKYSEDSYYSSKYFDFVYGKEGKTPVATKDITEYRKNNYLLAEVLDVDFSSLEDADKTEKTALFKTYYDDLKSGKKTFNAIYEEYNSVEDSNKQDSYATVLGTSTTSYASDNYDTVKAMKNGEVKLVKKDDDAGYTILVKKDLEADSTKIDSIDSEIRHGLKDEDFEKEIDEFVKTLKFTETKSATKQFKVKKIEYPQTEDSTTTTAQ